MISQVLRQTKMNNPIDVLDKNRRIEDHTTKAVVMMEEKESLVRSNPERRGMCPPARAKKELEEQIGPMRVSGRREKNLRKNRQTDTIIR